MRECLAQLREGGRGQGDPFHGHHYSETLGSLWGRSYFITQAQGPPDPYPMMLGVQRCQAQNLMFSLP